LGKIRFIQGNEAIAEGALAAGARFYAGYPITPSSEIAEIAARRMLEVGGIYLQMEDEIASMAAIIGASCAGTKAFTATSGPGFSLMQENLGLAVMAEVPCVVVNVQRSGPSTGLATKPAQADVMQARWGRHGDQEIIALSPTSVQECFDLTVKAFNLSERFRVPVILLADEIVGHMRENVSIPEEVEVWPRRLPTVPPEEYRPFKPDADGVPPLAFYGSEYVFHITGSMHDETGYANNDPENARRKVQRLRDKIQKNRAHLTFVRTHIPPDAKVVLVAYGATARSARAAMKMAGPGVGLLELVTLWPFPDEEVREALAGGRVAVVPEMNLGQVSREVSRATCAEVVGVNKSNGEPITPYEILDTLKGVM